MKQLLNQAYQPLNAMLNSWIFDGELHDHYHEVLHMYLIAGFSLKSALEVKESVKLTK